MSAEGRHGRAREKQPYNFSRYKATDHLLWMRGPVGYVEVPVEVFAIRLVFEGAISDGEAQVQEGNIFCANWLDLPRDGWMQSVLSCNHSMNNVR